MKYRMALNGLRGFAIINVLLNHLAKYSRNSGTSQFGVFGVSIFFVLSSYLLTQKLYEDYVKKNETNLLNYFNRRFFRIYPCLTVCLIFDYLTNGKTFDQIISIYFLYGNYHFYWTIYVEMRFYLVFPIFSYTFSKIKLNSLKILTSLLLIIGFVCFSFFYNGYSEMEPLKYSNSFYTNKMFVLFIPNFLMGCLLAVLIHHLEESKFNFDNYSCLKGFFAFIMCIFHFLLILMVKLMNVHYGIKTKWGETLEILSTLWGIIYSILVFCLIGKNFMTTLFEIRLFQFFGNISYPAYLLNIPFRNICDKLLTDHIGYFWATITSVFAILLCSYLIHITLENYFIEKTKNYCIKQQVKENVGEKIKPTQVQLVKNEMQVKDLEEDETKLNLNLFDIESNITKIEEKAEQIKITETVKE